MRDISICFIGSNETAKLLANKATTNDLELSHYAKGDEVLTIVRPIGFPDKIKPLIQAVNMSEYVIIEIDEINKSLGEVIILLDLLSKKGEFLIAPSKQYLKEQVEQIIKDTTIKDYNFRIINNNEDIKNLREELLKIKTEYGAEPLIIIDDFFNVKNVGTVALGFTKGGLIKSKDQLTLQPGGKKIQINSVQVMDVDYKELNAPSRVGLALKNCSIEDLERGSTISKGIREEKEITGSILKAKFVKKEVSGQLMIINGLISSQAEIKEDKIIMPKKIPITSDTIIYDQSNSPRILGILKKSL
ncbi:MAG TPA: hypothetical protein VI790_04890 [Candidatus Nanoarchaeia archaeon]|nr:hypothetical protein [Candidatus Nanoarchaeia archaeon]